MRRPTRDDVLEAAVREHLWPKVLQWLNAGGWDYQDDPVEVESSIKDLVDAVRFGDDGLKRAKQLDDWEPDMELAEILDGFSVYRDHRIAVAKWVETEKLSTPYKVGDEVAVRENPYGRYKAGVIDAIDEKHAMFTVRIPSEGHESSNVVATRTKSMVCHGWLVPWEDVKPVSEAVPSPSTP